VKSWPQKASPIQSQTSIFHSVSEMKKDFIHRAGKDIILLVHQIILNCIIEAILKLQAEVTFEFHRD